MALNYYHILEVGYNASLEEVKLAYRRLAKKYHPDVNANDAEKEEMFKLVNEAYKVLSDADRKAAYDLRLLLGVYDEQVISAENSTRANYHQRAYYYRTYYRRKEPVTYSRKTYLAVTLFLLLVASAIWVVPLTLSWYSSLYHYNKGIDHYEKGEYFAALNSLDRAIIDFGSRKAEACLLSASILLNHFNHYSLAIEYANKGLAMSQAGPDKARLLYVKGLSLKAGANYTTALQQLEQAKLVWPEYDSLYYAMGNIQAFYLEDYASALDNYDELLHLNPAFAEAYYDRAYTYFRQGNNGKANQDIDRYLSYTDKNAKAFVLKGELALRTGNAEEACVYFQKASLMQEKEAEQLQHRYCR